MVRSIKNCSDSTPPGIFSLQMSAFDCVWFVTSQCRFEQRLDYTHNTLALNIIGGMHVDMHKKAKKNTSPTCTIDNVTIASSPWDPIKSLALDPRPVASALRISYVLHALRAHVMTLPS
jgi:hypothetical protein